jgi:hypothetical protein
MARPRTPTKVLKALGSLKKHPERERARGGEPEVDGKLGRPPNDFLIKAPEMGYQQAARLRAIWRQIERDAPWLDKANRMVVRSLCYATDQVNEEFRRKGKGLAQALANQRGLMNDLGIPQAARSRLKLSDLPDGAAGGAGSVRMNLEIDL